MAKKRTELNGSPEHLSVLEPGEALEVAQATVAAAAKKSVMVDGPQRIEVDKPQFVTATIDIIGLSPLIVHAWSQKAINTIQESHEKGKVRTKTREPKIPANDFEASMYKSEEGWHGLPAGGFKAAMVGACRCVSGFPMTVAKRILFVEGDGICRVSGKDLVRIYSPDNPTLEPAPLMRRDMVRLDTGVADVRFRAEYRRWACRLRVTFLSSVVLLPSVINLMSMAGQTEGTGEWRPSSPKSATGSYGRFRVAQTGELNLPENADNLTVARTLLDAAVRQEQE